MKNIFFSKKPQVLIQYIRQKVNPCNLEQDGIKKRRIQEN